MSSCLQTKHQEYIVCVCRSQQSTKRKAPDSVEESPTKRLSPPKKSHSVRSIILEEFKAEQVENIGRVYNTLLTITLLL